MTPWVGEQRGAQEWNAAQGGRERPPHNQGEIDPGQQKIDEILNGKTLPVWDRDAGRFDPLWDPESIEMADKIIESNAQVLVWSREAHDENKREWKANGGGAWVKENLGWLERTNIWDRVCKSGAVISLVVKLVGLQLEEKTHDKGIDRAAAAKRVH